MPIVEFLVGHFVLRCVNYHGEKYAPKTIKIEDGKPVRPPTTMEELPGWGLILNRTMERGVPVRVFRCRECGYVEMYAGLSDNAYSETD